MTQTPLKTSGIELLIDGDGPSTVVMVHGWPDTYRLWDSTVEALKSQHRCVRFTLPGFEVTRAANAASSATSASSLTPQATSLAQMSALLREIVNSVSPNAPVTLLLHDWGCMLGYEFAAQHPARVARIVAVDIGDHNAGAYLQSLSAKAKWQIFAYQLWLAIAWKLGTWGLGSMGNRMTRWMAKAMRCRAAPALIGWQMNYPYAMQWFGTAGGLRRAAKVDPQCPLLYLYGTRKPFMFHSTQWLERLAARPGCAVQAFKTGHWVMVDQPVAFNDCVSAWLAKA